MTDITPPSDMFSFAVEPGLGLMSRALVASGVKLRTIQHGDHAYAAKLKLRNQTHECYYIYGKEEKMQGLWTGGTAAQEEIMYVAMRLKDGTVFAPHRPFRHHDVHQILEAYGIDARERSVVDEGFLTSWGRFVDREEGLQIALRAQQVRLDAEGNKRCHPSYELFSEDIW